MFVTVPASDIGHIVLTEKWSLALTRDAAHELTADELEYVSGGLVSVVNEQPVVPYHHPVTSPETTMFRPPSKKRA